MNGAIDVIDALGDRWSLSFLRYNSKHTEAWWYCGAGPMPRYNRIPTPVFTDWWTS